MSFGEGIESQDPEQLSSSDVLGMLTGSPENLKPSRFRVSRPCYDKFHRCPGWAGGGMRYAKVRRCNNGYIGHWNREGLLRLWAWRLYRCPKCRVIVLPYMIRWLDISWWKFKIRMWYSDWEYEFFVKDKYNAVEWWIYCRFFNKEGKEDNQ